MFALVTLIGSLLCGAFFLLSIGAGLYYLAEFAEEKPHLMKRGLTALIYLVAALHVSLLIIDRYPFLRIIFSMLCLGASFLILPEFPAVEYTHPLFIAAVALSFVNHFSWFIYFVNASTSNFYYGAKHGNPSVIQVTAFFGLIVWAVPLGLLVSLVSPSSYLPTTDPNAPKRQSAVKTLLSHFDVLRAMTERASSRLKIWSDEEECELVWLTGPSLHTQPTTPVSTKKAPTKQSSQWTEYLGFTKGDQVEQKFETVHLQQVTPDLKQLNGNTVFNRPAIPYSQIIRQAMEASPRGKLLLKEIYEWFESFHPYYTQENKGWKNSVRHTLSANRQFLRLPNENDFNNKGSEWCLVESSVGQNFLKHRRLDSVNASPNGCWSQTIQYNPPPSSVYHEEKGPLKRARSTDVLWSGGVCALSSDTPAHLLGMTPNPDLSYYAAQTERRHVRSLSLGDDPVNSVNCTPHLPPPMDVSKSDHELDSRLDFDLKDIIIDIDID